MAGGLPIKIVVLTIVGLAGLAAMLAVINGSENAIPKAMHADVKNNNLVMLSKTDDNESIKFEVEVLNSKDGSPVEKARAALSGMDALAINITDDDGKTILQFQKSDFYMDTDEGYLRLEIKAPGFQDYASEYAIKIVR
ncbi:MAG: hypothetical protein FIB08_04560 [Candidatus Methanoperedens sp.]|nr:hypothetical protein [Candidatus Methanoperedens sp.]